MSFIFGGVLVAILMGLIFGSMRRDREQERAVTAVRDRLSLRYRPDDLFVSPYDQSAIGLCVERGMLVLGDVATDAEYPFAAILEVEGLRDGVVLRRSRASGAEAPAAQASPAQTPATIRSLELRITVDDPARPVWLVRFFDWPGAGVSPRNAVFLARAADTEHWFGLISDIMGPRA